MGQPFKQTVFKTSRDHIRNLKLVLFLFLGMWVALAIHFFIIQIVRHRYFLQKANQQALVENEMIPRRGGIFDRHGRPLALNLRRYTYFGIPHQMTNRSRVAQVFGKLIGKEPKEILKEMDKRKNYIYLARKVSEDVAAKIDAFELAGIYREEEDVRYYPYEGLASQVVGYTDIDNRGIEGIEYKFDSLLAGEKGYRLVLRDGKLGENQRFYELPGRIRKEPRNGCNLYTTIDIDMQQILEDELIQAINKFKAELAIGIIMDVRKNEVIAMANVPIFDPNKFPRVVKNDNSRNRAITDIYEPGSTFKIVAASAALQEKVIGDNDLIFANQGEIQIGTDIIRDGKGYGWLSLKEIIQYSSNVGIIKVSERLESKKFYEYIKRFGFGMQSGIALPGEADGLVRSPDKWSLRSKATMSIGQELAVTPIQLINAYNALARDGVLYEPIIIERIENDDRNVLQQYYLTKIRQIVDPATVLKVRQHLVAVVNEGTGRQAMLDYIPVAGKTGTAQYVNPVTGEYERQATIPSFVGFLPADDPIYSCLIIIKNPQQASNSGGLTAGPVFRNVFQRIYALTDNELERYIVEKQLVIPLEKNKGIDTTHYDIAEFMNGDTIRMPDFRKTPLNEAFQICEQMGLIPVRGNVGAGLVTDQSPLPDSRILKGRRVVFYARPSRPKLKSQNQNRKIYTCEP